MVRSDRNSNSSEILCMSLLPSSIKRIGSKATQKRWRHHFPHYKSMGAFCCHGNQSFGSICPKTLCSLSPAPMMLHIKFDQDWPTGNQSFGSICPKTLCSLSPAPMMLHIKFDQNWPTGFGDIQVQSVKFSSLKGKLL